MKKILGLSIVITLLLTSITTIVVSKENNIILEKNNEGIVVNKTKLLGSNFYSKNNLIGFNVYSKLSYKKDEIYSVESITFQLFLKDLVTKIELFLINNPEAKFLDGDNLIDFYLRYNTWNSREYGTDAFETFWWGFKWWITWNSFVNVLNNAGNNLSRNSISGISPTKMAGYVIKYLGIKFKWVLAVPKIGIILGGILGSQVAGCLIGRQFWNKNGIVFRMVWLGVMTGCWDQ